MVSAVSPERRRGAIFDGPLRVPDASAVRELRAVLDHHGFTSGAVADALGSALPAGRAHLRDDMPLYLRRVSAPTPINTLVKLFVLDRNVDEARAAQAFAPLDLDTIRDIGLIEQGPRGIRATVRLSVHDGLLLAHDAYDEEARSLRPDHVLDVNPTTITLSNLTVRRPVARALEIGTGCGALALRAARHAQHVIGTDTNPRALNIATFNAAINGVTNVEWRLGSLFEAVEGEQFDLIFCNPPYVISPDTQFIFRDGGRRGDELCEEIVRSAPRYLMAGGFATVLVNWGIGGGEEWPAAPRRWTESNGCDTWIMMSTAQDPTAYAAMWTRSRDREAYTVALDRWIQYFADLGLHAIGMGGVVIRRREHGQGWTRADRLPDSITSEAGPHIERLFLAEDRLAGLPDAALMTTAFRAARDHVLKQSLAPADAGGYAVDSAEVHLLGGLPFKGSVDTCTMQLLAKCDGSRPLDVIAAEIAAHNELDPATCASACAGIARRLIASGFLV